MTSPAGLARLTICVLALAAAPVAAVTVIVPDDFATVQAAIDSGADTVFIREGSYPEAPSAYRGITLLGVGEGRPYLGGLAISNPYEWLSLNWSVTGIDFAGPVTIATFNFRARFINVALTDCGLGSGLQHVMNEDAYDINVLSLTRCRLAAASSAVATDIIMHADTVDAGVDWYLSGVLRVTDSWFRGGPNVALYAHGEIIDGEIRSCLFEDYNTAIVSAGLDSHYPDGFVIASNSVRRMRGAAIIASCNAATLSHNTVIDCGEGLRITQSGNLRLRDNTILRCGRFGLLLDQPEALVAERNIVGHCGGSAIVIRGASQADFSFTNNTLIDNAGSGFELLEYSVMDTAVFRSNLVAWNARYGLLIQGPRTSVMLGCNDWFANDSGSVAGATESGDDLELNPWLCDLQADDFTLFSDSPLLARPGCGQIGARGSGCIPTALKVLDVESGRDGLGIAWSFESTSSVESWIERTELADGPWDSLGTGSSTGSNSFELLDRAVAPDRSYRYRVAWRDRGAVVHGSTVLATWSDAGRLSTVTPNPAFGEARVEWVLSRAGATDIRIFDLAGREVSMVTRGEYGVGRHEARWDGRLDGGRLAPAGMYVVRVSSRDLTSTHRILLLR